MINGNPSKQTQARMEILLGQHGAKQTAALWQAFLRERKFNNIDEAWDKFEEWLQGVNENVATLLRSLPKLVGKR